MLELQLYAASLACILALFPNRECMLHFLLCSMLTISLIWTAAGLLHRAKGAHISIFMVRRPLIGIGTLIQTSCSAATGVTYESNFAGNNASEMGAAACIPLPISRHYLKPVCLVPQDSEHGRAMQRNECRSFEISR